MKRNFLWLFLCVAICCFTLIACNNDENKNHIHTFNDWQVVEESTCLTQGIKKRTCSCGTEELEKLPLSNVHSFSDEWSDDEKYHWHKTICGHSVETVDKEEHTYNEDNICITCHCKKPSQGLEYVETLNDTLALKSIGECKDKDVVIPSHYNGKEVTSICDSAFYNYLTIESVTIPKSIKKIGKDAFYMGEHPALDNSNFDRVNYTGTIDEWAMIEFLCDAETFSFSSNPLVFGQHLYIDNQEITELNITKTKKISDYAFFFCKTIKNLTIGENVESIGKYSFCYCENLCEIEIQNSVISIGECAFIWCSNLTNIKLGENLSIIGEGAFGYNTLQILVIPNNVEKIDNFAFVGSPFLKTLVIGEKVKIIGDNAFNSNRELEKVYYVATKEEWNLIEIGEDNENLTNATRFYYSESKPIEQGNFWHYDDAGNIVEWI